MNKLKITLTVRIMSLFDTSRKLILVSFMSLPLMLICYTFFMGFGLGNVGLIILFFGQLLLVPLVIMICQSLSSWGASGVYIIFVISLSLILLTAFFDNIKDAITNK